MTRDQGFDERCNQLGIAFESPVRGGANYDVAVAHAGQLFVSGMIPRVQGEIVLLGRVGETVSLVDARRAAQVCVLRAIAVLRQSLGSLDRIQRVLRMNVFVQSAADFTQQSEVADAASDILYAVFAPHGAHTRTSVGVYQLPKNASVEIDLLVAIQE